MTICKNSNVKSVSREIGGRTLTIETGWMAKQAAGTAIVSYGETVVMATVVDGGERDMGFFPLTVDYREKTFAAGKIPGGFFKREGRPTTKEILAMRLTDRSVRPMFAEGYKNEVQIMSSVLSFDQENEPEILSMVASFAALHISHIPFEGPMGAIRLGWLDGNILINPTHTILADASNRLDLTLAATQDAIVMVEAGAKELPEAEVLQAMRAGHEVCRTLCEMCEELRQLVNAPDKTEVPEVEVDTEMREKVLAKVTEARLREVILTQGKHERSVAKQELCEEAVAALAPEGEEEEAVAEQERVKTAFSDVANQLERDMILEGTRVDGRDSKTIRPIDIEVGLLPRAHGSVLFTRGETQSLVTCTLGTSDDEQIIDGLREEEARNHFMLHYNFPPFCVGEARMLRGTSRREYGHGALAERAVRQVLPEYDEFRYTIRLVSDILESNGSSSMASVCGGTLALMDAGVKIKDPVAGIAMGLVMEGDQYVVLSDILGSEDHHGDMDFKVAGTRSGITALQMDIKIKGLADNILEEAVEQARQGRLHILDCMAEAISEPRQDLSVYAPVNETVMIPPAKVGFLIGPKGANIRKLQEEFKVDINVVGDDGLVEISGRPASQVRAAAETIRQQTKDIEAGTRYRGKVTSVKPFGCFVDLGGGQEGMCHISELAEERINEVTDICNVGDEIDVIVVNVDPAGKVRLSRRVALLPEEQVEEALAAAQRPQGGGRGGRSGGRDRDDRGRGGYGGRRDRDRDRSGDRDHRGDRGGGRDRDRFAGGGHRRSPAGRS